MVLTHSEPDSGRLIGLSVVVEQVEQVLHLPIREQRAVHTEQHRVTVVDAAEPHGKPGSL